MNRLFVDNLTVIDFSYLHTERGILGESWIVDVELQGELDEQGMVFDFGDVKKRIKSIIDSEIDHKLVLPEINNQLLISRQNDCINITYRSNNGEQIIHHSPDEAITAIQDNAITKDNVNTYLCAKILEQLPTNVTGINLAFRDEVINGDYYHYSHGLKKHKGNCQRIAHGHRSKIDILKDGKPAKDLEHQWATRLTDIYIGTLEDLTGQPVINGVAHSQFEYTADQGRFSITLPTRQVYLINTDSTVEWIATHIAESLKEQYPTSNFRVKAFEGVGKGAIAER